MASHVDHFQAKVDNHDYLVVQMSEKIVYEFEDYRVGSINKPKWFLAKQEENDLSVLTEIVSGSEFN